MLYLDSELHETSVMFFVLYSLAKDSEYSYFCEYSKFYLANIMSSDNFLTKRFYTTTHRNTRSSYIRSLKNNKTCSFTVPWHLWLATTSKIRIMVSRPWLAGFRIFANIWSWNPEIFLARARIFCVAYVPGSTLTAVYKDLTAVCKQNSTSHLSRFRVSSFSLSSSHKL